MDLQGFPSEQMFRVLAEHSPDLLWAKDLQGRYLFVNQATCERLLITSDLQEPLGKTGQFFFDRQRALFPDNPHYHTFGERSLHWDQVVLQTGEVQKFVECGRVQGEMLCLDVVNAPLFNDRQELVGTMGQGRIVSSGNGRPQLRFGGELLDKVLLFQNALNTAAAGVAIISEGIFIYVNDALATLTGYAVEELVGKRWQVLPGASQLALDGPAFTTEKVAEHKQQMVEVQWYGRDGLARHILLSLQPIASIDGAAEAMSVEALITAFDITPAKHSEEQAVLAYNELEQIFNVTIPLCILSPECKVTKVNHAFCTFMGVGEEEILGKTGEILWQCRNCGSENCYLRRFNNGEAPIVEELEKTVNGQKVWVTVHAAPFVDPQGKIQGVIVTFLDTTEQKIIQQSLDNTQRQLLQAEKLSAVGALTASITHELNNPVCGIKNVLQRMLRKGGLEKESASLMELAAQECTRIEQMVRDLQDFNLPPAMEQETFDFHAMLDAVLLFLRRYIKSHAVTFITEYKGPLWVCGVKDQLKQVCLSLLTSSANAMDRGNITLSTRQHPDHITLLIYDDGLGIKDEELKQLFDPMCSFASQKMIGLKGIATAQAIMRSQGGDIQVQAVSGKGMIIKLLLPLEKQEHIRS